MDFDILKGRILTNIENRDDVELVFTTDEDKVFKLYHMGDCCESVYIEDICGELSDLIGNPILDASEVTHNDVDPPEVKDREHDHDDSFTWTFYKLATIKGSVTIRWLGESNGYYSESVDFEQVKEVK